LVIWWPSNCTIF